MGLMEDYIVEEVRGRMDRQFYEDMDKLKSTWNVIQKAKSSRDTCHDVARVSQMNLCFSGKKIHRSVGKVYDHDSTYTIFNENIRSLAESIPSFVKGSRSFAEKRRSYILKVRSSEKFL